MGNHALDPNPPNLSTRSLATALSTGTISETSVERTPVEIWCKIASMACTDGGYTGGSLAAASRFMQNATKPYRFHTISFTRDSQMYMFADGFELSSSPKNLAIRHLFFSVTLNYFIWQAYNLRHHRVFSEEPQVTFMSIIRAASPTLYTLMIHNGGGSFSVCNPPLIFPVLTDFTTNNRLPPGEDAATCFPSLRRLHFVSNSSIGPDPSMFYDLVPTLTHFRLDSGALSANIAHFLYIFMNVDPATASVQDIDESWDPQNAQQAVDAAARLSRLQHVKVYFRPYRGRTLPASFSKLSRASSEEGTRDVQVLSCGQSQYACREAISHWFDLIEGGDGPWTSSVASRTASFAE